MLLQTIYVDYNEEDSRRGRVADVVARVLLFIWVVLLIPWAVLALPAAGLAFDSGNKVAAALFALSMLSYGPAVFGAFKFLDRSHKWVLLPLISIAGIFLSDFLTR